MQNYYINTEVSKLSEGSSCLSSSLRHWPEGVWKNKSLVQFNTCLNWGAPQPSSMPNGYFIGMLPQKVLHGLKGKMGMACSCSVSTSSLKMVSGERTCEGCICVVFNLSRKGWRTVQDFRRFCVSLCKWICMKRYEKGPQFARIRLNRLFERWNQAGDGIHMFEKMPKRAVLLDC